MGNETKERLPKNIHSSHVTCGIANLFSCYTKISATRSKSTSRCYGKRLGKREPCRRTGRIRSVSTFRRPRKVTSVANISNWVLIGMDIEKQNIHYSLYDPHPAKIGM
jgi:hypothetical protein